MHETVELWNQLLAGARSQLLIKKRFVWIVVILTIFLVVSIEATVILSRLLTQPKCSVYLYSWIVYKSIIVLSRIFPYFFFLQTEMNGPGKSCFVVQWHSVSLFNRCTVLLGFNGLYNTRIYKLISVSQITRFLLGGAIISSETDPHNGRKKEKRSYGKIKNKTILKILPFVRIFYL